MADSVAVKGVPPGEEIVRQVRAEFGSRTLLSFSRGKDAVAAHIAIRDHFEEVIPYHLHLVPGLEFVEESLDYYEREVFKRPIYRLPHPTMYRWLRGFQFQTCAHATVIEAANLPEFDYSDIVDIVATAEGLEPEKVMVASGVRAADSPMRRVALMTHGAISRGKRQYYPVWDWNKARILKEIEASGIGLPLDYDLFGRSFDGLDLRFVYPLKKQRPRDYARILELFPLVEVEVWRFEKYGQAA